MNPNKHNNDKKIIRIAAILGWLAFALSLAFPEHLWGVSSFSALPNWISVGLLAVSFGLIFLPAKLVPTFSLPRPNLALFAVIGVMVSAYCWFNPIPVDIYGDSVFIFHDVNNNIPEWDSRLITEPLKPDFLSTKSGLDTFYQLNNLTAWALGINGRDALKILQTLFAFIYTILWLSLCKVVFNSSKAWFWLFALVGLTSPTLLSFMCHFEYYYLTYTGIVGWMLILALYFIKKIRWLVFVMPIAFLLLIQTHITNWLFAPSLAVPIMLELRQRVPLMATLLQPRSMKLFFGIPFVFALGIAYFGIYKNYDGPRQFSEDNFENSLFLPLYTDEGPPLDRYNLFNLEHFVDYFNLGLISSSVLLLLFGLALIRVETDQQNQEVLFIRAMEVVLTCYLIAFFFLNPLLSSMIDWDLFVLPWFVFLLFSMIRCGQLAQKIAPKAIAGPLLGLLILGIGFFPVHASTSMLAKRYSIIGKRNFKTYWMGSSTPNINAVDMLYANPEERKKAYIDLVQELQPYTVQGNDREYAALLLKIGRIEKELSAPQRALFWMEESYKYEPDLGTNLYHLALVHYELENYESALKHMSRLIELRYQPLERVLRMGIHIALAAKDYQAAANYSVMYLNRWKDDPAIEEVEYRLRNGIKIELILDEIFLAKKDSILVSD